MEYDDVKHAVGEEPRFLALGDTDESVDVWSVYEFRASTPVKAHTPSLVSPTAGNAVKHTIIGLSASTSRRCLISRSF
jgi:hypothetical protein